MAWAAIALGLGVFAPVNFGGKFWVNLSLFDLVVPGLFAWALVTRRIGWPASRGLSIAAAILALIVAHSIFAYQSVPNVSVPWLLRDTAKLCAVVVLFTMLCGLFRQPALGTPKTGVLALALLILIPPAMYLGVYQPIYIPRTILAATVLGLFILALRGCRWRDDKSTALRAVAAAAVIVPVLLAFYSKSMVFAALFVFLWVAALTWTHLSPGARGAAGFGAAAFLVSWGGIVLLLPGSGLLEGLQPASLERSMGIRVALWSHAWDQLSASFPIGIGLGQYATTVHSVPLLALEGHGFVHSTFLGLIVELGLLGAILSAAILVLIVRAGFGWGRHYIGPYLAFMVPLVLMSDAQGVRIVLVVAAIGVMHAGRPTAHIAARSSGL